MGISLFVKLGIVFFLGILSFIAVGSSIPLLSQKNGNKFKPGELLAISSFGNCLGFLSMTFFIFEYFDFSLVPILIGGLAILSSFIYSQKFFKISNLIFVTILIVLSLLLIHFWPTELLKVGYRRFNSIQEINYFKDNFEKVDTYKKFDNDVSVIKLKDGSRWLTLNGYLTLAFKEDNDLTTLRETIIGISPALFSKNQENALVIGLGSGVTARASSQVFSKVRVVDINPAMIEIMEEFKNENYDILNQDNVEIVIQDGIIELFQTQEKYDTIINTLTTPTYYSASKFWTKNVYDQISQKLNPDGVYAAWFDSSIGKKGIQIMAKTLKASFEDCRFIVLNLNYHGTICKNKPIKIEDMNKINWNEEISNKYESFSFSDRYDLNDFLKNLIIEIDDSHFVDSKTPLNTFNHQVLGFKEISDYNDSELVEFLGSILEDNLIEESSQKCQAYEAIARGDVCRYYNLNK